MIWIVQQQLSYIKDRFASLRSKISNDFRCDKCSETLTSRQVRDGHDRLTNELKSIEKTDIANLDNFLKKYATIIPDTHQLSREIQYSMVLLMKSKSQNLPTQVLLKKTVICSQLLELADKIEPGMTKWRGQILFELQSASVILAQRAIDEGRLEKYKAQVKYIFSGFQNDEI